jgi:glycine/D-amino acid oxidase-like deaminating enzyme
MRRRNFLITAAAFPFIACSRKTDPPLPPGTLSGGSLDLGHRLRQGGFAAPTETRRVPLLIVGAGIAGLSAAWRLERAGFKDFLILELEDRAGGNSRYGENQVSAHPLGAHYLPLPSSEATAVRELLADLGAIEADPRAERPRYDERRLCHTPQERVYRNGLWEDGLLPHLGAGRAERDQFDRFQARMAEFREARDAEGRRAFALPVAEASRDARWRLLDTLTMAEWLAAEGFDSERLHWYVNYACRDDYGTDYRQTSAWAGIHYFACRNGQAANAAGDAVLTAPEGNGWIVRELVRRYADRMQTGALTFRLAQDRRSVEADAWLAAEHRAVRFSADRLIWAAPLFVLPYVAEGLPPAVAAVARAGEYAPWLVANLTLRELPAPGAGAPLAWDNVLYDAPGLGYVVATHQNLRIAPGPTVLTYYRALSDRPPLQARQLLQDTSREACAAAILDELSRAHGDLPGLVTGLDIFRHGHAMIRPTPGVIHDPASQAVAGGWGRVQFAHADLSGLSLFEEANYQGVRAAEAVLPSLGIRQ